MATNRERLQLAGVGLVGLAVSVVLAVTVHVSFAGFAVLAVGLLVAAAWGGSLRDVVRTVDEDLPPDPGAGPSGYPG